MCPTPQPGPKITIEAGGAGEENRFAQPSRPMTVVRDDHIRAVAGEPWVIAGPQAKIYRIRMRRMPQREPTATHTSTRSSMPRLTLVGDRLPRSAVEEAAVTRERFDSRASSSSTRLKTIAHKLPALDRNQPRYGQLNRAIREVADCRRDSQPCHDVIARHTPQQWIWCHDGAGASGDWILPFVESGQASASRATGRTGILPTSEGHRRFKAFKILVHGAIDETAGDPPSLIPGR
jgi:hypothetical protein